MKTEEEIQSQQAAVNAIEELTGGVTPISAPTGNEPVTQPPVEPSGGGQPVEPTDPGKEPASSGSASGDPAEPPADPNTADPQPPADPEPPQEPTDGPPADPETPTTNNDNDPFTTIEDPEDPSGDPSEPPAVDPARYETLSEETGYEITSDDDVIALVNHLETRDPYEGLSPLIKQAIEVEKNGGDVTRFLTVLGKDVEKMDGKQALFEQYLDKNPDLAEDEDYARQRFEREYNGKYSILTSEEKFDVDFDTPEEYEQYKRDVEFAKKERAYEESQARKAIKAKQDKTLQESPAGTQLHEQKAQKVQQQYAEDSEKFNRSFDGLQIPIDESGKTFYNVSLNEDSQPLYDEWRGNPEAFMEYIGFDPNGESVDAQKLNAHMALTAMLAIGGPRSFGNLFSKALTERINKQTLETELEHPIDNNKPPAAAGSPREGGSDLEEAVGALADLAQGTRRR